MNLRSLVAWISIQGVAVLVLALSYGCKRRVEVKLDRLLQIGYRLRNRLPLTRHVNLEALSDIPVLLLVDCRSENSLFTHSFSVAIRIQRIMK